LNRKHEQHTASSSAPAPPPHHQGSRFCNAIGPAGRDWKHYLRWAALRRRRRWPKWIESTHEPQLPGNLAVDAAAATFIGHSSFLLQIGGKNLLTDPVYSERVGPFNLCGPRRVRAPGVSFEKLPPIHGVLLSHNHYDHMDLATLHRLQRAFDPWIVTSLGTGRLLRREGFRKVTELDWWEQYQVDGQLGLTFTPAQHFSSRHFFDRDRALWGGFIIQAGARRIYFAGDSGYGEHFKEIGSRLQPIELALVPIGGYQPRWFMQAAHIGPEEAVQVHLDVQSRLSVAMHFGTFQLTDEGIDEPITELRAALQHRSVTPDKFLVPEFGQTILLPA
jgi:L-ascorbate metabolism protein UlaG (beta-lactamase superfamily)